MMGILLNSNVCFIFCSVFSIRMIPCENSSEGNGLMSVLSRNKKPYSNTEKEGRTSRVNMGERD